LLLNLRKRDAPADASPLRRGGFKVWAWLWSSRAGFVATAVVARAARRLVGRRLRHGPGWIGNWARYRDLP
jgi:hypothetical protein